MGTSGLPDIYTRSQRAAGLRTEGVYQVNHECTWYNYYITLPCTNCVGECSAAQTLFINDVAVFIFPPIAFDFGFEM